jgi:chromosome condensin MukBEF ATPase and DNA-binding subunit MukB
MKNLLNEATIELMGMINEEFVNIEKEMKETATPEEAFRLLKQKRNRIEKMLNILENYKGRMEIQYPEYTKEIIRMERFIKIGRMQLEFQII